jgi:uncharacterized membrane protein
MTHEPEEVEMLPNPLHPAIVHFPIALVFLAPIFAFGALWAIRRGAHPLRSWGLTLAVLAALVASSWIAVETGEQQEDRVKPAVPKGVVHDHEEAAETFLFLAGAVLIISAAGLIRTPVIGRSARIVGAVGTLVLVGAGWKVGHTGGELVYRHGAASAYTQSEFASGDAAARSKGAAPAAAREADEHRRERKH